MRTYWTIAIIGLVYALCSPACQAQLTVRPLTVWIDTTRLTPCDSKSFLIKIWASYQSDTGRVIGFTREDGFLSLTTSIQWDATRIQISPIMPIAGHLAGRAPKRFVTLDDKKPGNLYIEFGIDPEHPSAFYGTGLPLMIFQATVIDPDTVDGLNGWMDIASNLDIQSERPVKMVSHRAGFVRVRLDTTVANIRLSRGAFDSDTSRPALDTISVSTEKLGGRNVNRISLRLRADTAFYKFSDTLESGTQLADTGWSLKKVFIAPDSMDVQLERTSSLKTDGPLLKIILTRTTDSAFSTDLTIQSEVNEDACLGTLEALAAQVEAARVIRKVDSIPDTPTVDVPQESQKRERRIEVIPRPLEQSVQIRYQQMAIDRVQIYNATGEAIAIQSIDWVSDSELRIRLKRELASGLYFVVLQGKQETLRKQFTFIK